VPAMALISLKLTEALDAQLTVQAHRRRLSKPMLVRRALTALLQSSVEGVEGKAPQTAADLVLCCEDRPTDLSSNPAYLPDFGKKTDRGGASGYRPLCCSIMS
jgi:hypothetical protein